MKNRILMALVCAVLAFGCKPEAPPQAPKSAQAKKGPPVVQLDPQSGQEAGLEFETVHPGGHKATLRVPGVVKANPNHLVNVSSLIPGRVIEATVNVGDRVRSGQVLARVDSTDLGLAQSEYLKAQARFAVAEQALERARQLLEAKVIGAGEYQRREGETLTTRADHRAAADRLILLGMTQPEIGLLAREQRINSNASIRSPLGGTVIERHVTAGEVIDSKTALFVVADLARLWILADLPEKDISLVQLGLPVETQVTPYPDQTFRGVIVHIGEVIEPATRTVKVRTEVSNPDGRLKPEMFATIQIQTTAKEQVLTVPTIAVQRDRGRAIVFVEKAPGRYELRVITTSAPSGDRVPVLTGLEPGERIVTKGAFTLKSEMNKNEMEPN